MFFVKVGNELACCCVLSCFHTSYSVGLSAHFLAHCSRSNQLSNSMMVLSEYAYMCYDVDLEYITKVVIGQHFSCSLSIFLLPKNHIMTNPLAFRYLEHFVSSVEREDRVVFFLFKQGRSQEETFLLKHYLLTDCGEVIFWNVM